MAAEGMQGETSAKCDKGNDQAGIHHGAQIGSVLKGIKYAIAGQLKRIIDPIDRWY